MEPSRKGKEGTNGWAIITDPEMDPHKSQSSNLSMTIDVTNQCFSTMAMVETPEELLK